MNMTPTMLIPFAPIIIVAITVMLVMVVIAAKRSHFLTATTSVIGLNIALVVLLAQSIPFFNSQPGTMAHGLMAMVNSLGLSYVQMPVEVTPLFMVDGFALFNMGVVLFASLACFTLAYAYIDSFKQNREELYLLMLLATIGAMLMTASQDLASFFMSLELLSVPTYGMLAYTHERQRSLEAGIKYLVLSATASAMMLIGMAFIYAYTGSLLFKEINLQVINALHNPLLTLGAALVFFGIAFKLSFVPFHTWTPDIYQGAPVPMAAFLATVSKIAMVALALRFLLTTAILAIPSINTVVVVVAVLSILIGNLLAVRQSNLKRLLGYASIAQLGYFVVVLVSLGPVTPAIGNLYMAAYVLTTLGAFGVIALMSSPYRQTVDAGHMSEYRGLFWRRPILATVLTMMMLSYAGIPLMVGFVSKFLAVLAAVQGMQWFLAGLIILGSAIGLYYYLKVMVVMFMTPADTPNFDVKGTWGLQMGGVMVILVTLATVFFGVYPEPLIEWSAQAMLAVLR